MSRTGTLLPLLIVASQLIRADTVPAGVTLEIRLRSGVSSHGSKRGSPLSAVLVAPVQVRNKVVLPAGTRLSGRVREVRRVGLGLLWERARLDLEFDSLMLSDGRAVPLKSRVQEIDNARESVDAKGRITGIRPTATLGHRFSGAVTTLAAIDPVIFGFSMASVSSLLRFSEPEIHLPAGTDIFLRLEEPIEVASQASVGLPGIAGPEASAELHEFLKTLPFRTSTAKSHIPSDLTNVVTIGSPGALQRAFEAAGWRAADALSAQTAYRTFRSIFENQEYREAPMSTLLLDGRPPLATYSKTLNTFARRHHLRVFARPERWRGETVLTISSTQDIGIAYSKKSRTMIHLIDEYIDNERAKVVNDLVFTGCVDAVQLVPRPWVPLDARNGTGERLITDGAAAVLKLNACEQPQRLDEPSDSGSTSFRPSSVFRVTRATWMTLRNDLTRGSFAYQGIEGVNRLVRGRGKQKEEGSVWRTQVGGEVFETMEARPLPRQSGSLPAPASAADAPPVETAMPRRYVPPYLEFGLSGGLMGYPTETGAGLGLRLRDVKEPDGEALHLLIGNELVKGWTGGMSVTLNSHQHLSHEFSMFYLRGKLRLELADLGEETLGIETADVGLSTRQFVYTPLIHMRKRSARIRPYVAAGPVFQMVNLSGTPFKRAKGVFRMGFTSLGMFGSSWEFASKPPLEGGGILQLGFQYGGGVKFHLSSRFLMRVDFRETISKQPDFWTKSFPAGQTQDEYFLYDVTPVFPAGRLRQQRFTTGFAITF